MTALLLLYRKGNEQIISSLFHLQSSIQPLLCHFSVVVVRVALVLWNQELENVESWLESHEETISARPVTQSIKEWIHLCEIQISCRDE